LSAYAVPGHCCQNSLRETCARKDSHHALYA
jgi:hypothetical protein